MNKIDVFDKEYKYIKDDRYKENIKILVNLLPDYFFVIPASSTGKYHPSFSQGEGGLVRHTKSAVRIAVELTNNNSLGHKFTSCEKDLMIMSLILHDGLKNGLNHSKYTCFDHPVLMSNYIEENKEKLTLSEKEIGFMRNVIESHMGEWNTDYRSNIVLPLPVNKYQRFVHMCDYLSSKKFLNVNFVDNNIVD